MIEKGIKNYSKLHIIKNHYEGYMEYDYSNSLIFIGVPNKYSFYKFMDSKISYYRNFVIDLRYKKLKFLLLKRNEPLSRSDFDFLKNHKKKNDLLYTIKNYKQNEDFNSILDDVIYYSIHKGFMEMFMKKFIDFKIDNSAVYCLENYINNFAFQKEIIFDFDNSKKNNFSLRFDIVNYHGNNNYFIFKFYFFPYDIQVYLKYNFHTKLNQNYILSKKNKIKKEDMKKIVSDMRKLTNADDPIFSLKKHH